MCIQLLPIPLGLNFHLVINIMKRILFILVTIAILAIVLILIRSVFYVQNFSSTFPPLKEYILQNDLDTIKSCIKHRIVLNKDILFNAESQLVEDSCKKCYYNVQIKSKGIVFHVVLQSDYGGKTILKISDFSDFRRKKRFDPTDKRFNIQFIDLFESAILTQFPCLK